MPLYEYLCHECFTVHEAERKISERDTVDCPACQTPAERQEIQLGGFTHDERVIPTITTEGATAEKYGKDWRDTKASTRMKRGEASNGKAHLIPGLPKGASKVTGTP